MSLTTIPNIRLAGGINEADAYLMFRVADEAALNTQITRMLARATAWLNQRTENHVYTGTATGDADLDVLFAGAEEALTMHFLTMPLKARKVYGTQFPYDSEGSERFAELIDVEWFQQMEGLVRAYLDPESSATIPFARPAFGATGTIDDAEIDPVTVTLEKILQRSGNRPSFPIGGSSFP